MTLRPAEVILVCCTLRESFEEDVLDPTPPKDERHPRRWPR